MASQHTLVRVLLPLCLLSVGADLSLRAAGAGPRPRFDMSGNWVGRLQDNSSNTPSDITATFQAKAARFSGALTVTDGQKVTACSALGSAYGTKVTMRVSCKDGTRAIFKGTLDVASSAIGGVYSGKNAARHTFTGSFEIAKH